MFHLASLHRAVSGDESCEIRQFNRARSRYGQEASSAYKALSKSIPKDGDGNHIPNQILLDLPLEEREMLLRVFVVDDYEPWRRQVCSMLQARPELCVVVEVADGLEAVQKA